MKEKMKLMEDIKAKGIEVQSKIKWMAKGLQPHNKELDTCPLRPLLFHCFLKNIFKIFLLCL